MKEGSKVEIKEEKTEVESKKLYGKRTPLYEQRALGIKEKPGFVRYQVVEKPGEVEKFMRAGYRPCTDDGVDLRDSRVQHDTQLGTVIRQVVNNKPGASAQTAIWMEIEESLYKEDQAYKNKMNSEKAKSWNPKNIAKSNPDIYYTGDLELK